MVAVREARKLFHVSHSRCFWWAPHDLPIGVDRVLWVAEQLRKRGGRAEWRWAARLEQFLAVATPPE